MTGEAESRPQFKGDGPARGVLLLVVLCMAKHCAVCVQVARPASTCAVLFPPMCENPKRPVQLRPHSTPDFFATVNRRWQQHMIQQHTAIIARPRARAAIPTARIVRPLVMISVSSPIWVDRFWARVQDALTSV